MRRWLRARKTAKAVRAALVEADAQDLIARFGEDAYHVARDRARDARTGATVDGNRPARHWAVVKLRIAELTGKEVGLDTATRYLQE